MNPDPPDGEAGIDLNRAVARLLRVLRAELGPGTELKTGFAAGLPPVRADDAELERTLLDLVAGAKKRIPGGKRLLLVTGRSGVGAFLRIEDFGSGSGAGITVSLPAA